MRPAQAEEIVNLLGASAGSLGGVGAKAKAKTKQQQVTIIADKALEGRTNMTTGANIDDRHLRGVEIGRDIEEWTSGLIYDWSIRASIARSAAAACYRFLKALEIGHIFKLGTKYSESMNAKVLAPDGKEVPIIMGSYGIGVERIMAAAIELHHDADGIIWPQSIAPFDVVVTITNIKQAEIKEAGEKLYEELRRAGLDVLLDDRDERAGVKFKDADLIGIPYRITVGKKISDQLVELLDRRTKTSTDIPLGQVVAEVSGKR
ncbi:MAG: His/Gly/Thr/Pro-type tRNA ligase C-terminal domain-containing protein [Pyrinomonadaceae bacterium]